MLHGQNIRGIKYSVIKNMTSERCILQSSILLSVYDVFPQLKNTLKFNYIVIHLNMKHLEMWWLNGSAPDFWGRGPGFESDISHKDPDVLQDYCVILWKNSG